MFSASIKSMKCSACGEHFCESTPTSVIPLLVTLVLSGTGWMSLFELLTGLRLLAWILGLLLALSSLAILYSIASSIANRRIRLGKCSKCGGTLEGVAGGFSESSTPSAQEAIILLSALGLPWLTYLGVLSCDTH